MNILMNMADRAWLPDPLIRVGIRRLNHMRLKSESMRHGADREGSVANFAREMRRSPIAVGTDKANDQHYELPAAFFQHLLPQPPCLSE